MGVDHKADYICVLSDVLELQINRNAMQSFAAMAVNNFENMILSIRMASVTVGYIGEIVL